MILTKEKAIKLHRQLWDWLYHHPSKTKENWPEWGYNGGEIKRVKDYCFLCEYAEQKDPKADCEAICPLDWSPANGCCEANSYFAKWYYATNLRTSKKYAKLIRDLPERK